MFQPPCVSLPQIKLWRIVSGPKALTFFDLSGAETLDFTLKGPRTAFKIVHLPAQLTSMTLRSFTFTPDVLLARRPYIMPNLTTLRLLDTTFHGELQTYLKCPKLKNLCLDQVIFLCSSNRDTERESGGPSNILISDALPFQDFPELELFSLARIRGDSKLAASLQLFPLLQSIRMDRCQIEEFITTFTCALNNSASFPTLKALHIDYSWVEEMKTSFIEFSRFCASRRPGMSISGNERSYTDPSNMCTYVFRPRAQL
jgi:hypothetical protein